MRRRYGVVLGLAIAFAAIGLAGPDDARIPESRVSEGPAPPSGPGSAQDVSRRPSALATAVGVARVDREDGDESTSAPEPARATAAKRGDGPARASGAADFSPARLDSAEPEVVRAVLARAIRDASRSRPLAVDPGVVDAAADDGAVRVIFAIDSTADASALARTLDSGGRASSVEDLRIFALLGNGAAKLSPGALLNLITETSTTQIELDSVHRPSLLESIPQIGADIAHAANLDGDGFAVAVIDTGVEVGHPMFGSRVVEEACFSVGQDCPNGQSQMLGTGAAAPCTFAGCDHGTHVAGIAVGDLESVPLVGVAPHAQLIAINVFSDIAGEAGAYTSDLLAAMQHVLALAAFHDIAAVNLSLAGPVFTSAQRCGQASPSQVNAARQLRDAGIATVAASGNDGLTNAISTPACLPGVLGVGSVGGSDVVSSFSDSADFLTLLAPGEMILSAALGGGTRNASGTSMASPHVAGAFAVLREARPSATVDAIENALVLSGLPILDPRNGITVPRIRVDRAIAMLEAGGDSSAAGSGHPASGAGSGGNPAAPQSGGGGGCGLVGIEPFLVLALARRSRRRSARMRS